MFFYKRWLNLLYKTTYTNNINGSIKIIKTEGKINIVTLFIHNIKKRLFKLSKLKEYIHYRCLSDIERMKYEEMLSNKARVD